MSHLSRTIVWLPLVACLCLLAAALLDTQAAAGDATARTAGTQLAWQLNDDSDLEPTVQDDATFDTTFDSSEPLAPAQDMTRRDAMLASLTIFVLAVFVGFELITKVPPTLHTPLMSGSNAISGITLVGAVIVAGLAMNSWGATLLGTLAVILATINVVGGFLVTHRMLAMFKRR